LFSLSGQSFGPQPFQIFELRDLLLLVLGQRAVRCAEHVVGVIFAFAHDVTFRTWDALIPPAASRCCFMTSFKHKPREPAKTKAELQEVLAQPVRYTQPQAEPCTRDRAGAEMEPVERRTPEFVIGSRCFLADRREHDTLSHRQYPDRTQDMGDNLATNRRRGGAVIRSPRRRGQPRLRTARAQGPLQPSG
jgi:hypothetical protein